jgi:hypothetical protein
MNTTLRSWTLAGCFLFGFVGAARGSVLGLAPVTATGTHTIIGDEIRLTGTNQVVTLEVKLSAWAPRLLRSWEARLNPATYANGIGDPLFAATVPCMNAGQCTGPPNNFGTHVLCFR